MVAKYRYDVYGNLQAEVGTVSQPYLFSTKRYDYQLGTYYYGYRFYSPPTGRWLSRDPLGEAGGLNLYGFVGNDPVDLIDPTGEFAYVRTLLTVGFAVDYGIQSYYAYRQREALLAEKEYYEKLLSGMDSGCLGNDSTKIELEERVLRLDQEIQNLMIKWAIDTLSRYFDSIEPQRY